MEEIPGFSLSTSFWKCQQTGCYARQSYSCQLECGRCSQSDSHGSAHLGPCTQTTGSSGHVRAASAAQLTPIGLPAWNTWASLCGHKKIKKRIEKRSYTQGRFVLCIKSFSWSPLERHTGTYRAPQHGVESASRSPADQSRLTWMSCRVDTGKPQGAL